MSVALRFVSVLLLLHLVFEARAITMQRTTVQIPLSPANSIGVSHRLKYYHFSAESAATAADASSMCKRVYIQASPTNFQECLSPITSCTLMC
jgi:hypothetical protein